MKIPLPTLLGWHCISSVLCFVLLFSQSMNLNKTHRLLSGDDSASESVGIITHYREEHIMSFKTTETNERR